MENIFLENDFRHTKHVLNLHEQGAPSFTIIEPIYIHLCAGTFLMLGRKRGDLKILWTKGEPERVCPHVCLESIEESTREG